MKQITVTLLTFIILLRSTPLQGTCCMSSPEFAVPGRKCPFFQRPCADGTCVSMFNCCGKPGGGGCDILCCNCQGGCRTKKDANPGDTVAGNPSSCGSIHDASTCESQKKICVWQKNNINDASGPGSLDPINLGGKCIPWKDRCVSYNEYSCFGDSKCHWRYHYKKNGPSGCIPIQTENIATEISESFGPCKNHKDHKECDQRKGCAWQYEEPGSEDGWCEKIRSDEYSSLGDASDIENDILDLLLEE